MPRPVRLDVETRSDRQGLLDAAKGFDKLDDKVGKLGDELKDTASDAALLDKKLEATGRKVKELAREIARASDEVKRADLERAFGDERRTLAKLRAVRRELDDVGDEADEAARKMAKVAAVGAGTSAAGAGAKSGAAFAGLFSRAVGSPLTLALVAGASAAAPLIGSVVGAALVGGAGAGGVGVGVAGAFTDPKVKAAAKEFGGTVAGDFKAIVAETFVQPTLAGIGKAGKAWRAEIRPEVEATLRASAKLVDPLVDAGIGFTKGLLPGIRSMVEDAGPVFAVLSRDLPALGRSLGLTFEEVGEHSEAISVGLHDAFIAIEGTVAAAGFLVSYLSESYAFTRKIAGFTGGPLALIDGGQVKLLKDIQQADPLRKIAQQARASAVGLEMMADATGKLYRGMLGITGSRIDFEEALDAMTESVRENGKGLDITGEKGRENARAVLAAASAALSMRDAQLDQKVTLEAADAAYAKNIQKVYALGRELGLSKTKVDELLAGLGGFPPAVQTEVKTPGLDTAITKMSRYRQVIGGIPGTVTTRVVGTNIQFYAKGGIAKAQRGLITSKPAMLIGEPGTGKEGAVPQRGISQRRAAGLLSEMAGWHGMDVVPRYANVTPASGGYNAMPPPRMSGGGRLSGTLTVDPGMTSGLAREIVKMLRIEIINDGGGNVQLALGQ